MAGLRQLLHEDERRDQVVEDGARFGRVGPTGDDERLERRARTRRFRVDKEICQRLRQMLHRDLARGRVPKDEHAFVRRPEPRMRAVTAYALRFMKKLQPATLKHVQERLQKEPLDAPDRVFYVITLYLHGPAAERSARKAELFHYAETGNPEAPGEQSARAESPVFSVFRASRRPAKAAKSVGGSNFGFTGGTEIRARARLR